MSKLSNTKFNFWLRLEFCVENRNVFTVIKQNNNKKPFSLVEKESCKSYQSNSIYSPSSPITFLERQHPPIDLFG